MSILIQNIRIIKVRYSQNIDLTTKDNGDKLVSMGEDEYIFDRSLYGTDKQFIDQVLIYIKAQYSNFLNNKIYQVVILPQGIILNSGIL